MGICRCVCKVVQGVGEGEGGGGLKSASSGPLQGFSK